MTEQKTFDYKGTKLVKVPLENTKENSCTKCFFEKTHNCFSEISEINQDCTVNENKKVSLHKFIEAKEELVNKIES